MRGRKTTPGEQLAKLRDAEVKAKQAVREAEAEALDARNRADEAEKAVRSAHAGKGGEVREAERALDRTEREVRFAALKVEGMQDRANEAKKAADQFAGANFRDLISESEPEALQAVDMMRRGLELLAQGDGTPKQSKPNSSSEPPATRPPTTSRPTTNSQSSHGWPSSSTANSPPRCRTTGPLSYAWSRTG